MKNIKKYILGFLATLMLCITSVVNINNTQNDIVVNAEESSDMVYVGTPINPTGTYDNVYFNTSLGVDEVNNILSKITYFGTSPQKYDVYCLDDNNFLRIVKISENVFTINGSYFTPSGNSQGLSGTTSSITLFMSITLGEDAPAGFFEDNISDFLKYFNFTNGLSSLEGNLIGQQNGILSELISSTPFEYVPITDTELVGTTINPTGTYDKIYFNTSLSRDEVIDILDTITYSDTSQGIAGYSIIAWNDEIEGDLALVIGDYGTAFGTTRNLVIGYLDTFIFAESAFPQIGINDVGWQNFSNPLDLSITGVLDDGNPDGIGLQNELISSIVSSTPFYRVLKNQNNNNESMVGGLLGAIATGINGIISPIIKGIENGFNEMFISSSNGTGTVINPIGTYDKLYFNTSLSVENVVSILDTLNYFDDGSGFLNYVPFLSSDSKLGVFVMKVPINETEFNYAIVLNNNVEIPLFVSASSGDLVAGWQQLNNPLTFDIVTGVSEMEGLPIGQQNELLKDLISSTPFESKQSLTPIAYFLIGMFGLSIGIGLVWLVISIMKKRK